MRFSELESAVNNARDKALIRDIKEQGEGAVIKNVGEMIFRASNKAQGKEGGSGLMELTDQDFGGFATYAYFIHRLQREHQEEEDLEKTLEVMMDTLAKSLIEEDYTKELQKILGIMQENMGTSLGFYWALNQYFICKKKTMGKLW